MSRILSAIVEVRLGSGKNKVRKAVEKANNLLIDLDGKKTIGGRIIGGVLVDRIWGEIDKPCIVPDFGHNVYCKCEHPETNGVLRLFGVDLTIEGWPMFCDVLGTYKLSDDVRMTIGTMSSATLSDNPTPLERIGD